jgi:hypothetical protein
MPAKWLLRSIVVGVAMAGGNTTRGELRRAFAYLQWKPTIGEVSDALRYLADIGRITWAPRPYLDSSDTTICLV